MAHHNNPQNDLFFKEILNSISKSEITVLLIYFAKEPDRIPINKAEDIEAFNRNKGDKNVIFNEANEATFIDQVKKADIVYMHGGNTLKLLDTLKKFPNLRELFQGKVVAGESAGSYVLSTYFYSKSAGGVFEGLGFVPVKTICHYIGENKDKLDELPRNLETLLLGDYQYKVYQ